MNTEEELVASWINGNRNWVRSKLRGQKKKKVLAYAKEIYGQDVFDDMWRNT